MSYDFAEPKTLTADEKLILRAMLTSSYSVSRPAADTVRYTFEAGLRSGSLRHFVGYTDLSQVLEWATLVAGSLSEERIVQPKQPKRCESWDEVRTEVLRLFEAKFDADRQEFQAELDESPEEFGQWHRDTVVVDGKVVDPWGPALSAPVRWWVDNMTLVGVWLVYLAVNEATVSCVSENLSLWATGNEDANPQKVAYEAFSEGMRHLEKDITEAIQVQAAVA